MSEPRARHGMRAAEAAMWAAVVLAGAYVLLPAAVELVKVREQENIETARADAVEERLRERQRELGWFSSDPQAAEKVREQRLVDGRKVDD